MWRGVVARAAGAARGVGEAARIGVDQRREIRPGVREEILDAAGGEELQIRIGRAFDARSLGGHRGLSFMISGGAGAAGARCPRRSAPSLPRWPACASSPRSYRG